MKKLMLFTLLLAMAAFTANAATGNNDVIGEWKYEVPTAPYGYEAGTLLIAEKEGNLAGEVKFADGYKIELKNVSYTDGEFKCGLYVDYEYISIKAKVENKNMTGTVETPEGEMKITAKKVK
jgi:hypothetical protein